MASAASARFFSPESLSASGRDAAKLSLPDLQSKMKCDPEGYLSELLLLYRHFDSLVLLFQEQSGLNPSTDPVVTKELADLAMLLSHVTPLYREKLSDFPSKVAELLRKSGKTLPAYLRLHLTQALILLVNRKVVGVEETLDLFMGLQILGDKSLQKAASGHIVQCIRRMNQKHKDEAKNRKLQNIMFAILQEEDEARAKRALTVLCQLHRRKIWFDERTANAICTACFHNSSRIMIATLLILLRYESIVEEVDSEDSSSEDDTTNKQKQRILLSREDVYKAHHKGTVASKKKKKAKLQRVMRSMRRQERLSLGTSDSNSYSPLTHLKDAQGFVEKLFSRLQKCNERFEVKMMMLKVIARTIGLHRLILLNFYPFLQKYVQPHQRDVTSLLAAAVQACHDMVPPDAVEPLFRQIVNQFVHDRARTEAIAVGINVVREICLRIPLLMTEDLLQDLVLYKKSHEKAISTAARSLMSLFRQICPSLLVKKDRGRPVDPKARPKAFGEASVASNVPGVDLLESAHASVSNSDNEECVSDDEDGDVVSAGTAEASFGVSDEDDSASGQVDEYTEHGIGTDKDLDGDSDDNGDDGISDENAEDTDGSDDELEIESESATDKDSASDSGDIGTEHGGNLDDDEEEEQKDHKRKFVDLDGPLDAAHASLRALKRLTVLKAQCFAADTEDGILSNEDFQRIKELQAKSEMKLALSQQGLSRKGTDSKIPSLKIPSSDDLRTKRVNPAKLEVNIKRKFTKEERLALVKAGREERGKYQSRTAVKQKKTGGLSNKQKEHKKAMPLAAKKSKVARSRQEKRKQQRRAGKQFRGKKAWK